MPHSDLHLRLFTPEDMEFLYQVYAHTRYEELQPAGWPPEQTETFLRMQFDIQHKQWVANYKGAKFWIVEAQGKPAGRLYLYRTKKDIRVMDIALLPKFRGKGYGEALLLDLQEEGRAQGKSVSIHVEENNRARNLYERLGFVQKGQKVNDLYYYMEWNASQQVSA